VRSLGRTVPRVRRPARVACLVANLAAAGFEPEHVGPVDLAPWLTVDRELLAILSYVEIATDRDGSAIALPEQRSTLVVRHGAESVEVAAFDLRMPEALEGQRLLNFGHVRQAS